MPETQTTEQVPALTDEQLKEAERLVRRHQLKKKLEARKYRRWNGVR